MDQPVEKQDIQDFEFFMDGIQKKMKKREAAKKARDIARKTGQAIHQDEFSDFDSDSDGSSDEEGTSKKKKKKKKQNAQVNKMLARLDMQMKKKEQAQQ